MRIDKNSRKTGKYAEMEKLLFTKFKERRARARKTSTKWLVHTAKHFMRIDFPDLALDFKGSQGWVQRFKRRWSIVTRKKTNVKNTTWDETEPKLQAYFCTFRRRLRDAAWWEQHRATLPAVAPAAAATPAVEVDEPDGAAGDELRRRIRDGGDAAAIAAALVARVVTIALASMADETASPPRSPRRAQRLPRAVSHADTPAPDGAAPETAPDGTAAAAEDPDLPWWKRGRGKWGKYLDFQRLNVDQVSHPIPSHPIPSHPIPSHPIPSHPIPSHPIQRRLGAHALHL